MFVLVIIFIVLTVYKLWQRRHYYRLSWQLPGPFAFPIIGNILSAHPNYLLSYLDEISPKYESPFRIWFGPLLTIFIVDAENVEIIMKSKDCLSKPEEFYRQIRDGFGVDGLLTLKANEWKIHRRFVSPTINQPSVASHLPVFNDNLRKFVASLPTNGEFFDVLPFISTCLITMFLEAAFGLEWEPEVKERYIAQITDGSELIIKRTVHPFYIFDFIWKWTKAAKQLKEYHKFGRDLFEKMLQSKIENDNNSGTFIGRLIDAAKHSPKFTNEDVLTETANILNGATDTTAIACAFTALMLAMHPEFQETAFEEILKVMPDKNVDLSQTDLNKLEFIELCVRETLRLFPTAPLIGRVAEKPITLSNNLVIPVGVPIIFGLRQIHLQEKYYGPTARIFNPYRFLDEKMKNLPASAYVAFSFGPRSCVGYYYAQASLKLFTAHLIRNYRITTTYTHIDQLHLVENISLKLLGKHMIRIEPRNK